MLSWLLVTEVKMVKTIGLLKIVGVQVGEWMGILKCQEEKIIIAVLRLNLLIL